MRAEDKVKVLEVNNYQFKDKEGRDVDVRKVTLYMSDSKILEISFDKNLPVEKVQALKGKDECLAVFEVYPDMKKKPKVKLMGITSAVQK